MYREDLAVQTINELREIYQFLRVGELKEEHLKSIQFTIGTAINDLESAVAGIRQLSKTIEELQDKE